MEKLVIPKGCAIQGDKITIRNEGDIVIESNLVPLSIKSNQGSISFAPEAADVTCSSLSAERGELRLQVKNFSAELLVAASGEISFGHLELAQALQISESVLLEGDSFSVPEIHAGDTVIHLSGMGQAQVLTAEGDIELILQKGQFGHIKAKKVTIQCSDHFEAERITASDGVVVKSGKVTIKMVDSPSFQAEPEVRGIVMLSTAEEVRAEGVRGFILPNEFKMLSEQGAFALEAPADRPSKPMRPSTPEPAQPPSSMEDADVPEEPQVLEDESNDDAEPEFQDSESEPTRIDTADLSYLDQIERGEEPGDAVPEDAFEMASQSFEEDQVQFEESGNFEASIPEPEPVEEVTEFAEEVSADSASEQPDNIASEDLPDLDFFDEPEANASEAPSTEFSLDFNAEASDQDVSEVDFGEEESESDSSESVDVNDSFYTMEIRDFTPPPVEDSNAEPSPEEEEVVEVIPDLPTVDSFEDFSEAHEMPQAITMEAFEDDPLKPDPMSSGVFERESDPTDIEIEAVEVVDFDGYQAAVPPTPPPVPPPVPEVLEDEDGQEEDEPPSPNQGQLNKEDQLVGLLTNILEDIKANFPDEHYPKFISQIETYLEERRFTILRKARNREAVLASFDRLDHPRISQLARLFYKQMADFFGDEL